jgi:ABC-type nitrate/sulfonate/bicarbonate transport system substrate-binding protein
MKNLKVIVFEGVQNLPIFAAQAQGYFRDENLTIDLTFTPNSWTLRDGLKDGLYDIAHTAVDNAVAMVDTANADVAVFMGGDNGFNGLFVQADINSIDDLRGKTV